MKARLPYDGVQNKDPLGWCKSLKLLMRTALKKDPGLYCIGGMSLFVPVFALYSIYNKIARDPSVLLPYPQSKPDRFDVPMHKVKNTNDYILPHLVSVNMKKSWKNRSDFAKLEQLDD